MGEPYFLAYPKDGSEGIFAVGTTVFDFEHGTIKTPAGAVTKMSTSIDKQRKDFMRSATVVCSEDCVIQIDENDKIAFKGNAWGVIHNQQFSKLLLTVTTAATGHVYASTAPESPIKTIIERDAEEQTLVTGTTVNAYATPMDIDARHLEDCTIVIANTGDTNSLTYQVLAYSNYASGIAYTPASGTVLKADSDQVVLVRHSRVKVQVKSTAANNHTAYQVDCIAGR